MAKGSILKEEIANKILETFPGSFAYDKLIIIPGIENSENLQIKVTLTCAKINVENGADNAVPGEVVSTVVNKTTETVEPRAVQPSEQEKKNVATLLESLGLV